MHQSSPVLWALYPFAALFFLLVVVTSLVAGGAERYLGLRIWPRSGQSDDRYE